MCDNKCNAKSDFKELLNPSNCYTNCGCEEDKKKKCTSCDDRIVWSPPTFSCSVPIAIRAKICSEALKALRCIRSIDQSILLAVKLNDYAPLSRSVCPNTILRIFLPDGTLLFNSNPLRPPTPEFFSSVSAAIKETNALVFVSDDENTGEVTYATSQTTVTTTQPNPCALPVVAVGAIIIAISLSPVSPVPL